MEIWLTRGMFGEKTERIAEKVESAEDALRKLAEWKKDGKNAKRYKIERYDRMLFGEDGTAVDFGDYCWFMLITGEGSDTLAKGLLGDAVR